MDLVFANPSASPVVLGAAAFDESRDAAGTLTNAIPAPGREEVVPPDRMPGLAGRRGLVRPWSALDRPCDGGAGSVTSLP